MGLCGHKQEDANTSFSFYHTKQLIGKAAGADSSEVGAATTAEPLLSAGNDNTPPIIVAKGVNVARISEATPFVIGSPPAAAPEVTLLLPLLAAGTSIYRSSPATHYSCATRKECTPEILLFFILELCTCGGAHVHYGFEGLVLVL